MAVAGASVAALGLAAAGVTYAATGGSDDPAGDLAEALNAREGTSLTAQDIQAAMKDVLKERLDEAVAAGRITQEQADRMLERADEGGLGIGPPNGPRMHRHLAPPEVVGSAATALGLGEAALREQLEDGKSLAQVAKARGVAAAKVVAAVKSALQDAPRGGRLTADRAQEIAERIVNAEPGEHRFGHGPADGPPPGP
jgi:hypothetical protein